MPQLRFKLILILFISSSLHAQVVTEWATGARSLALGQASLTLIDQNSILNNPGALGYVNGVNISSGYQSIFQSTGLQKLHLAYTQSLKRFTWGTGIQRFGNEFANQSKISLGAGNNLGIASLGGSINYHQHQAEGFETRGFATIDIGGVVKLTNQLRFGGRVTNLTQTKSSSIVDFNFPTSISLAFEYLTTELVSVYTQYFKVLDHGGSLSVGLEYRLNHLTLRSGFATNPATPSFGIGFKHKTWQLDYALSGHQVLGVSQGFNLTYHIRGEK